MSSSQPSPRSETPDLIARMECLPLSRWHIRARILVGAATFFDAFDVQAIAVALPVLVGVWHLNARQTGFLISTGFAGQIAGALLFGWIAEKYGRRTALVHSVGLIAVMSLACAFAWSYASLFLFRTIQGVGIGGEVPVAAAYISELAPAPRRGRFFLLYEMLFSIGLTSAAVAGYFIVPRWGWQPMFVLGALPALLALFLRRMLPESPRWLVSKGRAREAEAVLAQISGVASAESSGPTVSPAAAPMRRADWRELFGTIYRRRTFTVWVIWFTCYFAAYGLTTWLPTLYRTVYKLDVATALGFALMTNLAGLAGDLAAALLIDRLGRRAWFAMAFTLAAPPLAALWFLGASSVRVVVLCASLSYVFIASNSIACYLYTPEIYPTRLRAFGSSLATVWLRVGSAIGPAVVGLLIGRFDLGAVFLLFSAVSLAGAVTSGSFALETSGRSLEEISP